MPTDPYSIQLLGWQGSAVPWSFTVTNPDTTDPTLPGTPMDVSGWTVFFTVKKLYSDSDDAAVWRHDFVMPELSIDGKISDELPDTITQKLSPGNFLFDVRVINLTSPEPQMMMAGTITIRKTVGTRIVPDFTWTPPA